MFERAKSGQDELLKFVFCCMKVDAFEHGAIDICHTCGITAGQSQRF
jgi:hypothetical protein